MTYSTESQDLKIDFPRIPIKKLKALAFRLAVRTLTSKINK